MLLSSEDSDVSCLDSSSDSSLCSSVDSSSLDSSDDSSSDDSSSDDSSVDSSPEASSSSASNPFCNSAKKVSVNCSGSPTSAEGFSTVTTKPFSVRDVAPELFWFGVMVNSSP